MKSKLIIASWLISISLLATNNIVQALIALCVLAVSTLLIAKYKSEVMTELDKLNKLIDNLINK